MLSTFLSFNKISFQRLSEKKLTLILSVKWHKYASHFYQFLKRIVNQTMQFKLSVPITGCFSNNIQDRIFFYILLKKNKNNVYMYDQWHSQRFSRGWNFNFKRGFDTLLRHPSITLCSDACHCTVYNNLNRKSPE